MGIISDRLSDDSCRGMTSDESIDWSKLYEELRAIIDGGSETMTHEEAIADLRVMVRFWNDNH